MRIGLFFLLAIISVSVRAQLPGTDFAKLIEQITGNAKLVEQYEQYKALYKETSDNIGKIASLQTDANNNAMANWAVRSNKSKADIQNLELAEKVTPALDACSSLAASAATNPCPRRAFVEGLYPTNWERVSTVAGSLGRDTTVSYRMGSILNRAEQKYPSGFSSPLSSGVSNGNAGQSSEDGGNSGGQSNGESSYDNSAEDEDVIPFEPIAMLSSDFQYLTLFDDDMQSTIDFIDLIAPPFVYTEKMQLNMKIDSRYKVNYMRDHAIKDIARVSLQDIASLRSPSERGVSSLTAMQDFADTQTSLAEKIGYSNIAVPSVVWRNIALMRAYQVHMALERFKLSLKRESVIATEFGNKMVDH